MPCGVLDSIGRVAEELCLLRERDIANVAICRVGQSHLASQRSFAVDKVGVVGVKTLVDADQAYLQTLLCCCVDYAAVGCCRATSGAQFGNARLGRKTSPQLYEVAVVELAIGDVALTATECKYRNCLKYVFAQFVHTLKISKSQAELCLQCNLHLSILPLLPAGEYQYRW